MIVKVSKISGGSAMRTTNMVGTIARGRLPDIGESLTVTNTSPLEDPDANCRILTTSRIVSRESVDNALQVTTETGSVYQISVESL
jgi:hypothetical protein